MSEGAVSAQASTGGKPTLRPPRKSVARYVLNGVGLAVILAVTWVVVHTAPTVDQWQAAMPVVGSVGDTLTGRNIEVTVHNVRIADSVTASNGWAGQTTGTWVVVDASAATLDDEIQSNLELAELQIGDVIYGASNRPGFGSIAGEGLSAGINLTGPLMFEIPRDLLETDAASTALLRFGLDSDPRLDSTIEVPVDLAELDITDQLTTDEPLWGNE
ncbi:MAG: hypothetical protein JWQ43_2143 [Glaciihabitans sp.]|nr:hypothetical protein [Glaciihabitans sp.]